MNAILEAVVTSTKLNVGDIYFEKKGELKAYKKIVSIKSEKSKYAGAPEVVLYHYIKCDKNGSVKSFQTGVCNAAKTDELLSCGEAEKVSI